MEKSKPCLLLLNDIHISKDNIPAFEANWQEALQLCREHGIREMALGGDLFFSRAAQTLDVLLAVRSALLAASAAGIRVTLAEGNHDKVNQEAVEGYCHVFSHYPDVTVVDDSLTLKNPAWDFVLHIMGYFPEDGSFAGRLERIVPAEGKRNYLYIHEGINGALAQPSEKELPANIFKPFDRVLVGHYHNRTVIPRTRIEYIGSSRQHNFGEDEEKGYTLLYTDGRHEFIPNRANLRYKVWDISVEDTGVSLLDELREMEAGGKYRVKVRVHAPAEAMKSVDKAGILQAGAARVELVADDGEMTEAAASALFEKFDSRRIRETYETFCREKQIGDVSLGLEYLSKIEMPCGD